MTRIVWWLVVARFIEPNAHITQPHECGHYERTIVRSIRFICRPMESRGYATGSFTSEGGASAASTVDSSKSNRKGL